VVIIFCGVGDDQCGGHEGEADDDEDQPRPDPHHCGRPPEEWYAQIFTIKSRIVIIYIFISPGDCVRSKVM
jgi:hypothetical protein